MNRRSFAGLSLAALGGVFVPRFGARYRQGSGLLVRSPVVIASLCDAETGRVLASRPLVNGSVTFYANELVDQFTPARYVNVSFTWQDQRVAAMGGPHAAVGQNIVATFEPFLSPA